MTTKPDLSTTMLGRAQRVLAFAAAQPARATTTVKLVREHPKMPLVAWPLGFIFIGISVALVFKFPPTSKIDWAGKGVWGALGLLMMPPIVDLILYSAESLLGIAGRIMAIVRGTPQPPAE